MSENRNNEKDIQLMTDRYKELCTDARYYDNKMWSLPTAAFSIMFVALKFIFELGDASNMNDMIAYKFLLSVLNSFIFIGFFILFAKYHLHQLVTQEDITVLREHLFGKLQINHKDGTPIKLQAKYTRQHGVPEYAPWTTKLIAPYSSTTFVLNVMVFTLICNLGISVWYLYLMIS